MIRRERMPVKQMTRKAMPSRNVAASAFSNGTWLPRHALLPVYRVWLAPVSAPPAARVRPL